MKSDKCDVCLKNKAMIKLCEPCYEGVEQNDDDD